MYTIQALHHDWYDTIDRIAQLQRVNTMRARPPHIDAVPNTYDTIRRTVIDAHRWRVFWSARLLGRHVTVKTVTIGYITTDDLVANAVNRKSRAKDYSHMEGKRIRLSDCDRDVVVHIDSTGLPRPLDPRIYAQLTRST